MPWTEIQLAAHLAVVREERNQLGIDFIAQRGFTELAVREKILQTSKMILCDMVSKEAFTKQLLLRPFLGGNCFSVHPYKSCFAHVCWTAQRSLQKAELSLSYLIVFTSSRQLQIHVFPLGLCEELDLSNPKEITCEIFTSPCFDRFCQASVKLFLITSLQIANGTQL